VANAANKKARSAELAHQFRSKNRQELRIGHTGMLGLFAWGINWQLDQKTTVGGIILQHVDATFTYTVAPKGWKHPYDNGKWDYYEAWQVPKNSDKPSGHSEAAVNSFNAQLNAANVQINVINAFLAKFPPAAVVVNKKIDLALQQFIVDANK